MLYFWIYLYVLLYDFILVLQKKIPCSLKKAQMKQYYIENDHTTKTIYG